MQTLHRRLLHALNLGTRSQLAPPIPPSHFPPADHWAELMRARVLKDGFQVCSYTKSSLWSGIKQFWNTVCTLVDLKWQKNNFWRHKWISKPIAIALNIPPNLQSNLQAAVADFIQHDHWLVPDWLQPA
ncbi:hypothetical protein glysoja_022296 [Glycine soja]|nr:hypothetical protein glysoja_022296 [Glycine soja]